MGYSMRTARYRFTEWIERDSGNVMARELYDHANDPHETRNLANMLSARELVRKLSTQRNAGWRGAKP